MDIKNNILETIGNTPMIRLNKVARDLPCTVLAAEQLDFDREIDLDDSMPELDELVE